ncbi:hypothetical protein EZ428_17515 [Pedobacter frigiditerrae]|uniref:Uncharacterized protein n=1 Tax=Pedobacter frigiditerrae TaxID=2530452 RepID=A0A4R0MRG7_9SPHI|nr:hypothetical protein [Pedobacter frigiditerrae]TCC89490.1 hypothetical protein EZ428_17515 [Pedobacter frigiditerrae]
MRIKKQNIFIIIIVLVIIGWMLKDMLTQTGIEDLKGGFKEFATYRNENNTGPIQRIYVVTVKDTLNAQLIEYGNLMPHSKYGNTKVYFFLEGASTPTTLSPGEINFDAKYNSSCLALYEKGAMGNFGLLKNPFK